MSTATEHANRALEAIRALRYLAARGDKNAAAGLLSAAAEAAGHLEALASRPDGHKVRIIVDDLAAVAAQWPVNVSAIGELRPASVPGLPAGLGSALPFRAKQGATKPRNFHGYTGLALDAFLDLDAIRSKATPSAKESLLSIWHLLPKTMKENWRNLAAILPPLADTASAIAEWKEAGTRWAEDQCGGQWKTFPWPAEVFSRGEQRTNTRKRGIETAVKEYLGKGFKAIARPLPLI